MKHRGTKLRLLAAAIGVGTCALAAVAWAGGIAIDDVELDGGGPTVWDPSNEENDFGDDCSTPTQGQIYAAADDGEYDGTDDGFDAGLVLLVNGSSFVDGDGIGVVSAEQLRVGPEKLGKLRVTRTERALQGSPTLRSLVKLKSTTKKKAVKAELLWGSDLGSDELTVVRGSSASPGAFLTTADRWVVTNDDAVDPGDPPVTHVFYGKGKVKEKSTTVPDAATPPGTEAATCVSAGFKVRVPARKTRYLLFFSEMNDPGDNTSAIEAAEKFDSKRLSSQLRAGLSKGVKKKIVNWDLVKEKKGKK
jgi:hypothetical protein